MKLKNIKGAWSTGTRLQFYNRLALIALIKNLLDTELILDEEKAEIIFYDTHSKVYKKDHCSANGKEIVKALAKAFPVKVKDA